LNVSPLLLKLVALSSAALIASCQTKPIKIQTTVSAECKTIPEVDFAWPASCKFGEPCPDPENKFDTEETVKKIMADNAAKKSLCEKET
jgi:hypothetical protein